MKIYLCVSSDRVGVKEFIPNRGLRRNLGEFRPEMRRKKIKKFGFKTEFYGEI